MTSLQVENLTKTYTSAGRQLTVLHEVSFSLQPADTFAIYRSC
jgi:putative ABC transport system ATP-binding protein